MKMITVKLQGQEVQAALLNPDVAKEFEDGFNTVLEKYNKEIDGETGAEGIKRQCMAVIDYVADIFGKDAARRVFSEQTDLLTCLDVLEEMQEMYETQVTPIVKEKTGKIKKNMGIVAGSDA